jgi:hypothetical protein
LIARYSTRKNLDEQDIFSPITVTGGKASPPMAAGLSIEVNKEKLQLSP